MLPTDQPSNNDLRAPRPNLLIPASNTASRSIQPSPLSLFRNPSPRPLPTPESESLTPRPTAPPRQQTPRITLRPSLPSIHTLPFQSQPDYPSHHQPQPQYTVRYQPYPTPQPTYIYAIPNPGTSFTGAQPFFTNTNATSQHFTPAPNTYNSYSSGSSPLDRTAPEKFLIGQPSGGSTMQYNSYQAGGAMQSSRNGSIGEGYGVERMAGGSSGDAGGYPRGYSSYQSNAAIHAIPQQAGTSTGSYPSQLPQYSLPADERYQMPSNQLHMVPIGVPPQPQAYNHPNPQYPPTSYAHPGVQSAPTASAPPPMLAIPVPPPHPAQKKVRTQFSACQACRNRRVKCDLKDVQAEWDSLTPVSSGSGYTQAGNRLPAPGGPDYPAGSDHKFGPSLPPNIIPNTAQGTLVSAEGELLRERGVIPTGKIRVNKNALGHRSGPDGPHIAKKMRDIRSLKRDDLKCTHCWNRGAECVDEFREMKELKAAKRSGGTSGGPAGGSGRGSQNSGRGPDDGSGGGNDRPSGMGGVQMVRGGAEGSGSGSGSGSGMGYAVHDEDDGMGAGQDLHWQQQPMHTQIEPTYSRNTGPVSSIHSMIHTGAPVSLGYTSGNDSSARVNGYQQTSSSFQAAPAMQAHATVHSEQPISGRKDPPPTLPLLRLPNHNQTSGISPGFNNGGSLPSLGTSPLDPGSATHTSFPFTSAPPSAGVVPSLSAAARSDIVGQHPATSALPKLINQEPQQHLHMQDGAIPDLSREFMGSAFYRRFHIQRPIIDPIEFSRRYLAHDPPRASHMGVDGSILCHIMYAWACSYGVNERGELDVPERNWPGGLLPPEEGYVWSHDQIREKNRLKRRAHTDQVVSWILKEIDDAGIMRRHSWDGVRCLLLILPLTEYVSTPMERLAMYECAVAQVFALCSLSSIGYDGMAHHLGPDGDVIRVRLYWYSFVHEGITTGLKGGRMVLDEEDLDTFQGTLPQGWALVTKSASYKSVARFATAPIRLALACRSIHKALTGPRARRQEKVDRRLMHEAWEALEQCWEEFDSIRSEAPRQFVQQDEIIRFADGWRIFMFEAHNVIRESLENRCSHFVPKPREAFLTDLSISSEETDARALLHAETKRLHEIARAKCDQLTRQIVDIVRTHINTTFFEWDASLVRDGTFYAAMLLAKENGSEADVAVCLQALNEMRWAYAKTGERSTKLRDLWADRQVKLAYPFGFNSTYPSTSDGSSLLPSANSLMTAISGLGANVSGWMPNGMMADTSSISQSTSADFIGDMADAAANGAYPSTAAIPPELENSPSSAGADSPAVSYGHTSDRDGVNLFYRDSVPATPNSMQRTLNGSGFGYNAPSSGIHLANPTSAQGKQGNGQAYAATTGRHDDRLNWR